VGILSAIMERRTSQDFHPSRPASWWSELFGGGPTAAGVPMSEWQALNLSTVWCCAGSIAIDIAGLPFHTYERTDEGNGRRRLITHPAWALINVAPNPEMHALDFWDTLQWWAQLWGNGYAEIERRRNGQPLYLWPMEPWRTEVLRRDGVVVYRYSPEDGPQRYLAAEDVFHLKGMGNGLVGMNVIRFARESLGAAAAAERFAARFFGNGAQAGVVLKHPKSLGPKGLKNFRESWEELHKGPDNAHKVAILEEGMDLVKTTFPPDEAQLLMTRQFSIAEICRWFRFPPHKAGDLSRATFSNIEQQDLAYVGDTLFGWIRRQEAEVNRKLVMPREQQTVFAERLLDAKLRADIQARYNAYGLALQNGFMNRDEVRDRENLNPIPDGSGKKFTVQVNMTTTADLAEPPDPSADPSPDPAASPPADAPADTGKTKTPDGTKVKTRAELTSDAHRELLAGVYERVLRVEADKVRRASSKANFPDWLVEFYPAHTDQLRGQLFPVVEAIVDFARVGGGRVVAGSARAIVDALAADHVRVSRGDVGMPGPVLEERLRGWESSRARDQAARQMSIVLAEVSPSQE